MAKASSQRFIGRNRAPVDEVPGNPGYHSARFYLRPHYQFEGVNLRLGLISRLPSRKAA